MTYYPRRYIVVLALMVAIPVHAELAPSPDSPVLPAQPSTVRSIWNRAAFEVGGGKFFTNQDQVAKRAMGFTLGVGQRVGDGALLFRYTYHNDLAILNMGMNVVYCEMFNACKYKSVHYDEYALVYRQKFSFISLGIGAGVVKRTVEVQEMVETSEPNQYVSGTVSQTSSSHPAIFYEAMLHVPVNRRQRLSIAFGLQGQYNSDFPEHSMMLTFQKGI